MKVAAATRHGDGRQVKTAVNGWERWMVKTADDNENGEQFMRMVDEE
jgi:hypothetical protein